MVKIKNYLNANKAFAFDSTHLFLACNFALIFCLGLYEFYFPIAGYSNLSDFFTGTTIYENYNKNLDRNLPFIFLFLSTGLYLFFNLIEFKQFLPDFFKKFGRGSESWVKYEKVFSRLDIVADILFSFLISLSVACTFAHIVSIFVNRNLDDVVNMSPILAFFVSLIYCGYRKFNFAMVISQYQWLAPLSLILYYPDFDYPDGAILTGKLKLLICASIALLYTKMLWNQIFKKNRTVFFGAPLIFLGLFYYKYAFGFLPNDDYHFGEQLVTFWDHFTLNFQLYTDIYPPHGMRDLLPGYMSSVFLGDATAGAHAFGETLIYNILLTFGLISLTRLFSIRLALLIFMLILQLTRIEILLAFTFFLLVVEASKTENWVIPSCSYVLFCFSFYLFEPTFAAPLILSSIIPFLLFAVHHKKKLNFKHGEVFFCIVSISMVFVILFRFHQYFLNNINFVLSNFEANLPAFGNRGLFTTTRLVSCTLQYLILPLIAAGILHFSAVKKKNFPLLASLSFSLLYPLFISTYSLGRLDYSSLFRSSMISVIYVCVLLPYFILIFFRRSRARNIILSLFFVFSILMKTSASQEIYRKWRSVVAGVQPNVVFIKSETIFGGSKLPKPNADRVEIIKTLFKKYHISGSRSFLDLTNRVALYYYLQKPNPTPFLAYYNIGNPESDRKIAKLISSKMPDFVLLSSENIRHDDLPISLRVNQIYRFLLLAPEYQLFEENNLLFLLKTDIVNVRERNRILRSYDNVLGTQDLHRLPDAWGDSFERLKNNLEPTKVKFSVKHSGGSLHIVFSESYTMRDFNLLKMKLNSVNSGKIENYSINLSQDCGDSSVKFESDGATILVPLDVIPTWLICGKISSMNIQRTVSFRDELIEISFHKRL